MLRLGIVGARGFVGGELLRLAAGHPGLRVTYLTSETQAGRPVDSVYPNLKGRFDLCFAAFDADQAADAADAFILARPDGDAMRLAPELLARGRRVVDVSGDFRVRNRARYEEWYRREHLSPELLEEAVYGLPELHPEVREARLVANPGCYPTAGLLAVAPLLASGVGLATGLVMDGKSGVSGAGGRTVLQEEYAFPAVNENVRPYSVVGHRHTAELEQEMERLVRTAASGGLTFTPHLMPTTRGLCMTCYVPLAREVTSDECASLYRDFYRSAAFVQVCESPPEFLQAAGSNLCLVHVAVDVRARRAICIGVIDNLVKGAAGQALQNLNLMHGLDEVAGLTAPPRWP